MNRWLVEIFGPNDFMPHYQWKQSLLWIHGISDFLIAISYILISVSLVYVIRKRKDLPFQWVFWAFGLFIVSCGITHFLAVWSIWEPVYWLSGGVKIITMLISIATAIALFFLIPKILTIPTPTELIKVNSELVNANKELESFSYSVSHDLRAPLRGIDGFSQALLEDYEDKLDDEGKDYLREIRDSTTEMSDLIDSLLTLSRITRKEFQMESVNLSEVARKIFERFRKSQPERSVDILIEEGLIVEGDRNLLGTMMANLLENAWKFTGKNLNARIKFGLKLKNNEKIYFVEDNGAGFKMEYSNKLFGVFQRLHRKIDFEGTGVGLANVQRIIARHGGRIWAEAEEGKGATFYFTLKEEA